MPPSPFIFGADCPFVATQVLSNAMHSSGVQPLTSDRETHPLAQLTLICPPRFGPRFYKTTGENLQYLMLLPSSKARCSWVQPGPPWHQDAPGGGCAWDTTGPAGRAPPQRSPLGGQALRSPQHRSVTDNWELKVIEILVGIEQLKLLNEPAVTPHVQPRCHRTANRMFMMGNATPEQRHPNGCCIFLGFCKYGVNNL